jgi:hypothetical protein
VLRSFDFISDDWMITHDDTGIQYLSRAAAKTAAAISIPWLGARPRPP